jgi:hypothetical protein
MKKYSTLIGLILAGLIISGSLLAFYNHSKKIAFEKGLIYQQVKLEDLARRLENFTIISTQLSKFIQINIGNKNLTLPEIEKKLNEFIQSAPEEIIYGIGIWYEPYYLNTKRKFSGPYIHRNSNSLLKVKEKLILTYEWEVPSYNYHQQDWYKLGVNAGGEGIFVKPYFDSGLVYVTTARAFFKNTHEIAGVITVDMILPQLQNIINSINLNKEEQIYITTNDHFLLAHPLEKLKNKNKSLIEYTALDIDNLSKIDKKNWHKKRIHIPALEWNIIVESSYLHLIQESKSLKSILK